MQTVETRHYSLDEFRAMTERLRNWGRWGPEDENGTLNLLTPQAVAGAAKEVKRGRAFSLAIPLDSWGPQRGVAGRFNPILLMTRDGGDSLTGSYSTDWLKGAKKETSTTDEVVIMPTQCATHWDSLAHVVHNGTMYNGVPASQVSSTGAKRNGIIASRSSLIGRGVLLDVPRALKRTSLRPGEGIGRDLLRETADSEGVRVESGDIILVRTGRMAAAMAAGEWGDYAGGPAPGLSLDSLGWLAEKNASAIASDTWGTEVQPFEVDEIHLPFHVVSLVYMGLPLGEIFNLDALAADCDADGVYSFLLAAQPLPFSRAVASPINPIALK